MNLFSTNVPALLLPIIIDETGFHLSPFSLDGLGWTCLGFFVIYFALKMFAKCLHYLFVELNKELESKK